MRTGERQIYIAITFLLSVQEEKAGRLTSGQDPPKVKKGQEILGPFSNDADANRERAEHGLKVMQHKLHPQYGHQYVYFTVDWGGRVELYDLERNNGLWHPYRIFLKSEGVLQSRYNDVWNVLTDDGKRLEKRTHQLTMGDTISVPYRDAVKQERVISIERVKIYWLNDEP